MKMTKKEQMQRRRNFFSAILLVVLVATMGGCIHSKMHHVENCKVLNIVDNTVFVRHSNGLTYAVDVEDPQVYQNIDTAKVVFDQFTDWEKNYIITDISPIE